MGIYCDSAPAIANPNVMFVIILDVDHHAVLSDGDAPNGPQGGTCAIWERFEVEFTDESW